MTTEYFVKPASPVPAKTITLTPIDQLHAPIRQFDVFCFKLAQGHAQGAIQTSLRDGLSYALAELPDFLSHIVDEEGERGAKGLKRLEIKDDASVRLLCKDYDEDPGLQEQWTATYEQLEKENMPSSKLTTPLLAQHAVDPEPFALSVQANFIPGGLILAVIWHHAVCDGNGLNMLLQSWSKHTSLLTSGSRPTVAAQPNAASLNRTPLMQGSHNVDISQLPGLKWTKDLSLPDFSAGIPKFTWAIWNLSPTNAAKLKKVASAPNDDVSMPWVSTGDAYTALLWKRYAAARAASKPSLTTSKLWFPVDFRSKVVPPLPATYLGDAVLPRVAESSTTDLAQADSLYSTATRIRQAVNDISDAVIREHIGFIGALPKISDVSFNVDLFGADLAVTNWADLGYLSTEWGAAMGRPAFLRRTGDSALFGGVAVVQPRDPEGGLKIMTLFEDETTEKLKDDETFREYFDFVCY